MKIENKEDIANFIESHLKELGGEGYGVNYIAEKLFEWHESELKNLRLGFVGETLLIDEDAEPERIVKDDRANGGKWVTEDCDDHTPYWGVCGSCGRY